MREFQGFDNVGGAGGGGGATNFASSTGTFCCTCSTWIVNRFPGLIDPLAPGPQADPHVIALALIIQRRGAGSCVVLSEEKAT